MIPSIWCGPNIGTIIPCCLGTLEICLGRLVIYRGVNDEIALRHLHPGSSLPPRSTLYIYILQFTFINNSSLQYDCDKYCIACPIHNEFIYIFLTKNSKPISGKWNWISGLWNWISGEWNWISGEWNWISV